MTSQPQRFQPFLRSRRLVSGAKNEFGNRRLSGASPSFEDFFGFGPRQSGFWDMDSSKVFGQGAKAAESDKINIDSIIARLLEGKVVMSASSLPNSRSPCLVKSAPIAPEPPSISAQLVQGVSLVQRCLLWVSHHIASFLQRSHFILFSFGLGFNTNLVPRLIADGS